MPMATEPWWQVLPYLAMCAPAMNLRQFASPVTLFSARVLNDRNEFDDEKLIINQMRTAIETFRQPPTTVGFLISRSEVIYPH